MTGRRLAAGLAAMAAAAVGATLTVMVLSGDNTVITAPPGKVTTTEGAWTFGATANGNGDYPLLVNGAASGSGASLRITNGQLYAFSKSDSHYWVRFNTHWVDIGAAAPVEGTYATKVTLAPASAQTPDNATAGTVIAKATVGMTPASATFVGTLVSTNPIYTFQGMNLVLSRGLTKQDDGAQNTVVTALD